MSGSASSSSRPQPDDPSNLSPTSPRAPSSASSNTTAFSSGTPSGQQDPPKNSPRPRKHVTTACVRCRQAKAKCDGNQPCIRCASRGIAHCTYKPDEDERTRSTAKRRLNELQGDSELLHDLLEHIRHDKDEGLAQVVSLIRSNASLEEINQYLTQLTGEPRSEEDAGPNVEELKSRIGAAILQRMSPGETARPAANEAASSSPRQVLSVKRLIDNPAHQIQATPWTQVTSDDHLVSHLISLWATWDNFFPNGVVLEFFLRDLRSKKLDSPFCSPFLVNCILAAGCPYSDYEEVKANQGTNSDLMIQFVKEAEKHLEEDNFRTTVTNVQGLSILFLLVSKMNHDRRGFSYATQAATLCAELMRIRDQLVAAAETAEEEKEIAYMVDYTCWGAFASTSGCFLAWQRPQSLSEPPYPYPNATGVLEALFKQKWFPYPREGDKQDMYLDEIQRHYAELAIFERDLSLILYEQPKPLEPERIRAKQEALLDVEARLTRWLESLPDHFKHLSPWTPPSVFTMRLWSRDAMMVTLMARMQYCSREDHSQLSELSERTPSKDSIDVECDATRARLLTVALEVVEFLRIYRNAYPHDVDRLNSVVSRPLHQALSILLEAKSRDGRAYDAQINDICAALRAISRRVPFVVTLLRAIQLDAGRRGLALPQETQELFDDFEQSDIQSWKEEGSYTKAMYSYANIAPAVGQQDNKGLAKTMGEFLQEFDDLDLETRDERSSHQETDKLKHP